jgi:chromosome segregation ATPase
MKAHAATRKAFGLYRAEVVRNVVRPITTDLEIKINEQAEVIEDLRHQLGWYKRTLNKRETSTRLAKEKGEHAAVEVTVLQCKRRQSIELKVGVQSDSRVQKLGSRVQKLEGTVKEQVVVKGRLDCELDQKDSELDQKDSELEERDGELRAARAGHRALVDASRAALDAEKENGRRESKELTKQITDKDREHQRLKVRS